MAISNVKSGLDTISNVLTEAENDIVNVLAAVDRVLENLNGIPTSTVYTAVKTETDLYKVDGSAAEEVYKDELAKMTAEYGVKVAKMTAVKAELEK